MTFAEQPKRQAASGYVARSEWMHDIHGHVRIMRHYASYGLVWAKCLDQYGKNRLLSTHRLRPQTMKTPSMYPHSSTNGDWDDETIDQLKKEAAELRKKGWSREQESSAMGASPLCACKKPMQWSEPDKCWFCDEYGGTSHDERNV